MRDQPPRQLVRVQSTPRLRWLAVGCSTVVGLGLSGVHWAGLLVGGALVGLWWPTFRRALLAGLAFGVVVLAAFAGRMAIAGTLGHVLGMGPLLAIAAVVPLLAGLLGAISRGLLPDLEGNLDEPK